MDKSGASNFQLVRILPKARPPLSRMAGLRHQKENSPEYDEDESSDYDDDDDEEIDDADDVDFDDVDASTKIEHVRLDSSIHIQDNLTPPLRRYVKKVKESPEIKYTKGLKRPEKTPMVERTERHIFCWVVAAIVPLMLVLFFLTTDSTADNSKNETETHQPSKTVLIENLERNIDDISNKFKKQSPDIWDDIIAGVAEVVKYPIKPAIFFLFANQDDTMLCLAKMVANASKAALGSDTNLWLSASDLGSDYGVVIDKFKDKIEQQKIVIVDNLLDIDPKAMLAFHHLCDRENPLVKKAVYIITMVAKGYTENQKPIQFVEDQLMHKMEGSVDAEKLQPLITRITDGPIIVVQPEPDIRSCPLRY